MKKFLIPFLLVFVFTNSVYKAEACHAVALVNFTQQQYVPGVGLQVRAASDSPTCGCGAYWLDMEIRCDGDIMNGTGLSAGVWSATHCFPYYQSAQMMKPNCVVQNYPWLTVPDVDLCPGITYEYRLRENHNGQVGPWTPIMLFTMPGVNNSTPGHLDITAAPNPFCISTQLGWNLTPGTGCGSQGCNVDTTFQWVSLGGDPIIVGVNFSCDTCPYPTAWPTQPTTYALNMHIGNINACGYTVGTQTPVTVFPLPWPVPGNITYTMDCFTGDINFQLVGGQGDIQWQTSVNGGPWTNVPGGNTPNYFSPATAPGTCVRVELSTVCSTIQTPSICPTIGIPPQANFSFANPCAGQTVQFSDMSNGVAINNWEWDFGDGTTSNLQNPSHVFNTGGASNVTLTVTNVENCTDVITIPVTIYAQPTAAFTVQDVCFGQTSEFINTSTITSGSINSWMWVFGDGNTSNQQNPMHAYAAINSYNVKLIATSDNGCRDSITLTTNVYFQPIVDFSATTVCGNGSLTEFTNLSNYNAGAINWDWDFGDGNTSNALSPSHAYATSGQYTVTLIGSTVNGCSATAVHVAGVYEVPVVDFEVSDLSACGSLCPDFTNLVVSADAIATYQWIFGDGNISSDPNPTHCYTITSSSQQSYTVKLVVTTINGCSDSLTRHNYITLSPVPTADFSPHPAVINENSGHAYFHNWSTGGTTYAWEFGDGNTSNAYAPHHIYQDTGTYIIQLVVFNQYGCSDTAYKQVIVVSNPSMYMPNAFSPNGDGVNDVLMPVFYSYEGSEYTFQVFDRNGGVVFETFDMNQGWDGTVRGDKPVLGTYVWRIVVKKPNSATPEEYTGHVTIVR
ncbi:MAG: PKD domain-containing protein [Flavobacteriales bacterium]